MNLVRWNKTAAQIFRLSLHSTSQKTLENAIEDNLNSVERQIELLWFKS